MRNNLAYALLAVVLVGIAVVAIYTAGGGKLGALSSLSQVTVQAYGDDEGIPQRYLFSNIIVDGQENIDLAKTITSDKGNVSTTDTFQLRFTPSKPYIEANVRYAGELRCSFISQLGDVKSGMHLYFFDATTGFIAHAPFSVSVVKNGAVSPLKEIDLTKAEILSEGIYWQRTGIQFGNLQPALGTVTSDVLIYDDKTQKYSFLKWDSFKAWLVSDAGFVLSGGDAEQVARDAYFRCFTAPSWDNLRNAISSESGIRRDVPAQFNTGDYKVIKGNGGNNIAVWTYRDPAHAQFSTTGILQISESAANIFTYRPLVGKPDILEFKWAGELGQKTVATITVKNLATTAGQITVNLDASRDAWVAPSAMERTEVFKAGETKTFEFLVYKTTSDGYGCVDAVASSPLSDVRDTAQYCSATDGDAQGKASPATGTTADDILVITEEKGSTCTGLFEVPAKGGTGCVQSIPLWAYLTALAACLLLWFYFTKKKDVQMPQMPLVGRRRRR